MDVQVPSVIDSVYNLPFEVSYLHEKLDSNTLKHKRPERKEDIWFRRNRTLVYITLFYNNREALKYYNSFRNIKRPIYKESDTGYSRYFVTYVKQGRADRLGLFLPMDDYYCAAGFLKNNLVIIFSTDLTSKSDDSLNDSIQHIGSLLEKEFNSKTAAN